ncbi:alpha/beta fold hydrolase [Nocardioides insulae]|uniref:alpha/beta fold hydrolase n=1 Tax=Nocardioides insulae TaxID=394734 RepID=UPI00041F87DB|nr:alpha/beta hydrolase [Nocardioides insulae]
MSLATRIIAGAVGVAAAGATVAGVATTRRQAAAIHDRPGDPAAAPLGSLRSRGRTVVAEDGVPLHVEVDEVDPGMNDAGLPTVVFVHGYALNADCWHFQRAALRGRVRTVFYDQRSHGRSGRSGLANATIEQLGVDLRAIIEQVVPEGPVVLVGHSMGGMSVVALAAQYPELFGRAEDGGKVAGVCLISTTAGGLDPSRVLFPLVPARVGGGLAYGMVRGLARSHRAVDGIRRAGRTAAVVLTDRYSFGTEVPAGYVEFVDDMLSATPFEVLAEFFPSFRGMDMFDAVEAMNAVPTTIICGTRDRITSIGHSRKLHSRIPHSTLVECEGAGHMVIMERRAEVDAEIEKLITAAGSAAA